MNAWEWINAALATAWSLFVAVFLLAVLFGLVTKPFREAWDARQWEKVRRRLQREQLRAFEERQLAQLAEQGPLWAPDRERLKSVTAGLGSRPSTTTPPADAQTPLVDPRDSGM